MFAHRIEAYPAKEGRNGDAVASLIQKFEVQKPTMVRVVATGIDVIMQGCSCCNQHACMIVVAGAKQHHHGQPSNR